MRLSVSVWLIGKAERRSEGQNPPHRGAISPKSPCTELFSLERGAPFRCEITLSRQILSENRQLWRNERWFTIWLSVFHHGVQHCQHLSGDSDYSLFTVRPLPTRRARKVVNYSEFREACRAAM